MFFRDLTIFKDDFKGYEGNIQALADEIRKVYCGSVSAYENEQEPELEEVTLYDFNWYGYGEGLAELCARYKIDLREKWEEQVRFDRIARAAALKI